MFLLAGVLLLSACGGNSADDPYLEFAGGGFIFNYRLSTADYGFIVKMLRQPPTGTVLEAQFEDPAGGPPIVVRSTHKWGQINHSFRTPSVQGVKAGRDYKVELRLFAPAEGSAEPEILATYSRVFRADQDQSVLPDKPLAPGPGYQQRIKPSE